MPPKFASSTAAYTASKST
jgi:hypothetical protein